ncbi:amino acid adenylation domain-containing protein [Arhodomonas sp. AD133]|uniref:amino acid adenylation domain-containing protein n=1 Tax=Arhodomonas sp. AD133 TaxID=3415009 RepID=UPI003EBFB3DB
MDVAIVGIGCRFPGGADSPNAFWTLLCDGVDAIGEMPRDRFDLDALYDPDPAAPGKIYTRRGGYLAGIDEFDAGFFGIAPREARRMDPQQRLLLEVAWEALEHGGQPPHALAGSNTGVFVGVSGHDYADIQLLPFNRRQIDAHVNAGSSGCIIANRLSYLLDLHGPSFTVDTACSSSLTAVHLACRSLAAGECDLAIAGGVNVLLSPDVTIGFCKAEMLSPDGQCRAFDAGANGYVRSEGVGAVVLKPLTDALADGDPIQAVIRGSAINQDGRTAGLSLPSVAGQEQMLWQALADAGVAASSIQYVEAHGTGTAAGDPVEATAIGKVMSTDRPADDNCLIGSVKTNVGHLELAAGVAGLIKATLALKHRMIPLNLHFSEPNPAIDFEALQLRVPTRLEPWPETSGPARAGVNSFGFGGANAHLVLEEPPRAETQPRPCVDTSMHVFTLSADAPGGLQQTAERHLERLRADPSPQLHDLCYTAAVRRSHHQRRLAIVAGSQTELTEHLETFLGNEEHAAVVTGRAARSEASRLAFVFSGMGAQWLGMGRQLLRAEPTFREVLEECDRILQPLAGWSVIDELTASEAHSRLGETVVVQVVNCAVQIALAAVWRRWGVIPDAIVGHSAGEMAAAHVAGALNLPDALYGAYHRGRLLDRATGTGTMLAAGISAEEAASITAEYDGRVSLAAVNSPSAITLSGEADALARIARSLEARERFCRLLPVEVPYHGPQMEAIREELLDALGELRPAAPAAIPFVSGNMGTRADTQRLDADYWWRNVRQPVLFADAMDTLITDGHEVFVEVSPHPVLAGNMRECLAERGKIGDVLPTLRRQEDERQIMLGSLATLYARGRGVDWSGLYPTGTCLELPTYPWQRERYWFDAADGATDARTPGVDTGHALLGRRLPCPQPVWEADLEDPRIDYLDTHVVEDSAVFPGAAYVEMALAAGRELWGEKPVQLEQVTFNKLLFLNRPRDLRFQLLYHPSDFAVEMHSAPAGEHLSWTLNAAAKLRLNEAPEAYGHIDLAGARERCTTSVSSDDQYHSLEQRGFRYGAPFRGLHEIWSGEAEAVARVRFPAGVELPVDGYRVHPALLDAAFQLFGLPWCKSSMDAQADRPLFPVSIDRIVYRQEVGRQFWAHMVLRHGDETQLEGDIRLVDDDGAVAIACEGLRIRILDEARPPEPREIDEWLYELRWEEEPLPVPAVAGERPPPDLPGAADIFATLQRQRVGPEAASGAQDYYDTVEPALARIATGFALAALEELGWNARRDRAASAETVAETLGIVPGYQRLLAQLLRMLEPGAEASPGDGAGVPRGHPELHGQLDTLVADFPAYAAKAELVRQTGAHLADILRGDLDAREILLTDESLQLLTQLYHASPLGHAYHELVADAVAAAVDNRPASAPPLRVLEIGAGTGAATATVLPRLPAGTEYVFTDISPHFLTRAQERFAEHAGIRYAVLDIETDPAAQGFERHSFDLIIAANVLHTTATLRTTLDHVQDLLAPGGLLTLLELTRPAGWFNLVFGLLDGWWRFADADLRSRQPLLQAVGWQALLEQQGFEEVTPLFQGERDGGELNTVLLAQAPTAAQAGSVTAEDAGRHWLIFADSAGIATTLAAALQARGDACTLACRGEAYRRRGDGVFELPPNDASGASLRLLADLDGAGNPLHGVIHLWSLDAPAGDEPDTAALMASQALGCDSVLGLMQALQQGAERVPQIWLVTSGSQPVAGHDAAPNMAQATLWGLGRVLMNEHAEVPCRLLDLSPTPGRDEIDALVQELCGDGTDEELALRGRQRLVRRLHRVVLDSSRVREETDRLSPDEAVFHLDIGTPGALESLGLQAAPPAEPGPGELSIRVMASGLSFRDVLHALGMLPAAVFARESGASCLGSECAGIVVACGEGVEEFRAGDEVMALASGTHGSRVIARADLAIRKPSSLSFEEGAGVLNAFVTADYALNHLARITAGERVLVHSAAGAVGLAAIAYCRRAGAEVYATAGTPEKRAYLQSLGIEHVMDSRSLAFADEILSRTDGEGVDVVLNSLAGEALVKGIDILRPYGRFIELGKRDIYENARLGLLPFQRNLSFHAVDLVQLALDRPELARSLLADVLRDVTEGGLPLVPHTAFDLAEAEQAFRHMAQAKQIGKVVLTAREPSYPVRTHREVPACRADATYLLTGGLGGFGLAVAQWLVEQGAQNLVLTSRSGTPKDDGAALAALRDSGARVITMQADVTREEDVARVLEYIRRELPPLKGIFHTAMVLDDDVLTRLDEKRFHDVLAPKVAGAWNLHRLTRRERLDYFVLFSSMASVIGHPLQANYAAANAFLDSLAAHRQALDLPALTIGWGALADVGYVARHPETAQYLDRGGFTAFSPPQALDTLAELLRHDLTHVVAARMDWSQWAALNPLAAASRRFEHFVGATRQDADATQDVTESPLTLVRGAAADERREVLERYVQHKVAKVIGTTPEKVDLEREFAQLGFDSLMAVELATAFKVDLAVSIPVVKILKGTSGVELAATLLDELELDATSPAATLGEPAREPAADDDTRHPLSFEQRRFWFLHRVDPDNPAYNLPAAARLSGPLDVTALESSINEVLQRHEVLRATFQDVDGEPVQVFAPTAAWASETVDLTGLAESDREAELSRRTTEAIQRPFDLSRGPLMRACIYRLAREEHALLLVVHHIACDAVVMNMLLREIAVLYGTLSQGQPASLPPPPASYLDYIQHQRARLEDVMEPQLKYWKRQLAGAPAAVRLPGTPAAPSAPGARGAHKRFELSAELTAALQTLSNREGATLFMTLLAAFQTLLHRYSGDEDICVGTAVSTRDLPGTEDVAGCFINTLVLRSDLSGEPTFRQLLQRVRHTTLEGLAHQDAPFDRVVDALQPERGPGRTPLFEAMLVLHNTQVPELGMGGPDVQSMAVESGTAVSDLVLLADVGERLGGTLEYNAERFDAATIERFLAHFRTLLEGIVADAERRLSALPMLSDAERREVLVEWNDTAADFGAPACLHQLVERQAEQTPHAVAVVQEGASLTYQALDQRANQLAHRLQAMGVEPDAVVAVSMQRSPESVVAVLGVLKAGGAYLPLDPDHPPERRRTMLKDAQATVLLTQPDLLGGLPEDPPRVLALDPECRELATESTDKPADRARVGNLAYVIYTSGSTGEPKGVMIPHQAICNQLHWRQRAFPLNTTDRVLQRTPVGFDPAVWELFGPLAAGAGVVMPPPGTESDSACLVRLIQEQQVTVLQGVPSLLDTLLEQPGIDGCNSLRYVFTGGEPLSPGLRDRFFACLSAQLHHLYGPSEATIDAAHWACRPTDEQAVVPIGRPIANTRIYLLDRYRQPVPVGAAGELHIGGAGLARGYLNRPQATAAQFIADPFADTPGERLYRTGDLGRWLPDGSIEFLGRVDEQLKIRGFRVEPGEVEAVLAAHQAVRDAAVVPRENRRGELELAAFVVAGENIAESDLQRHAAQRLPDYMVPSTIQVLDTLPRTNNDKLDRAALAQQARTVSGRTGTTTPPRDPVELQLRHIWEAFFPGQSIGVTDDFFQLGGHSLLAMRLVARIHSVFDRELPVSSLIQGRTIEQQACLLREQPETGSPMLAVQPHGAKPPLFCVHPVGGTAFCYMELAAALGNDRPFYALEAAGLWQPEPHTRIEDMAQAYVRELQRVQPTGPYVLGGWSMGGVIAFEMARQLEAQGQSVARLLLIDAPSPAPETDAAQVEQSAALAAFMRELGLSPHEVTVSSRDFWHLSAEQQLACVLEHARKAGLVPPDLAMPGLHQQLRVFTANLRAMHDYVPAPYAGHLTLIEAETPLASPITAGPGWDEFARGGVTCHTVPGDHYTMLREPHVAMLARQLTDCLDEDVPVAS